MIATHAVLVSARYLAVAAGLAGLLESQPPAQAAESLTFVPIMPCRLVDTREDQGKTGPYGPPMLEGSQRRTIPVANAGCDVPAARSSCRTSW